VPQSRALVNQDWPINRLLIAVDRSNAEHCEWHGKIALAIVVGWPRSHTTSCALPAPEDEVRPCVTSGAPYKGSTGRWNRENGRVLVILFALRNIHEDLDGAEGHLGIKIGIGDPKPATFILYCYKRRVWSVW
jgi:hypothetical protein